MKKHPLNKKFNIVLENPIKEVSSNGGRVKELIVSNDKNEKFRIYILSESCKSQSYARLSKWTDQSGYAVITSKNPSRDYNIDISYSSGFSQSSFDPIIKDLLQVAESF